MNEGTPPLAGNQKAERERLRAGFRQAARERIMGFGQEFLDVGEAAIFTNTSSRFIRRLVAEKRITYYKVGGHLRLRRSDLEAFVEAGRVPSLGEDQ